MVTIIKDNYEIELLDNVFEKMLEYCKQSYGWDKDELIDKISQSHVNIRSIDRKRKIGNKNLIYIEERYFLVDEWIFNPHIICPVFEDPKTGLIGTAKEI